MANIDKDLISLNKFISSTGFCSRRDADKLIEQARVTVNDELVLPGHRIHPGDVVAVDGEPLNTKAKQRPIYIALNKPVGVTSTTDVKDRTNIIYFINHPKRIFPIGRLDKDSDGLIFLTNDGDIVNKILRASNHHEKEYIVNVDKAVTPEFVKNMSSGVPILDTITNKCFVRQEGSRRFRIILTQGLNRQIRRMCEHFGYKVVKLTRVRVMNVSLENLPVGKWRYLTLPEVDKLNDMVKESSKTPDIAQRKPKREDEYLVDEQPEEKKTVQYIPKRRPSGSTASKPARRDDAPKGRGSKPDDRKPAGRGPKPDDRKVPGKGAKPDDRKPAGKPPKASKAAKPAGKHAGKPSSTDAPKKSAGKRGMSYKDNARAAKKRR